MRHVPGELRGMGDSGSEGEVGESRVARAFGTSVRGNSTAFGFSIMITVSFGMVSHVAGAPNVIELLLFGVGAAVAIAALEGVLTRGFRAAIEQTSQEVQLLGTAMNFASVAAGVGAALGAAELMGGTGTWPATGFAAALTYIGAEGLELLLAEQIQAARGAPVKESEEQES